MHTPTIKVLKALYQQQPRFDTFQPYNNQFYVLEVYPTTFYNCILHYYYYYYYIIK